MYKFVETIEEVLSTVSTGEGAIVVGKMEGKEYEGFIIQDIATGSVVWGTVSIDAGTGIEHTLVMLSESMIGIINMHHLVDNVPMFRDSVLHISNHGVNLSVIGAEAVGASYATERIIRLLKEQDNSVDIGMLLIRDEDSCPKKLKEIVKNDAVLTLFNNMTGDSFRLVGRVLEGYGCQRLTYSVRQQMSM